MLHRRGRQQALAREHRATRRRDWSRPRRPRAAAAGGREKSPSNANPARAESGKPGFASRDVRRARCRWSAACGTPSTRTSTPPIPAGSSAQPVIAMRVPTTASASGLSTQPIVVGAAGRGAARRRSGTGAVAATGTGASAREHGLPVQRVAADAERNRQRRNRDERGRRQAVGASAVEFNGCKPGSRERGMGRCASRAYFSSVLYST